MRIWGFSSGPRERVPDPAKEAEPQAAEAQQPQSAPNPYDVIQAARDTAVYRE
jgi:hypothetical protein